MADPPRLPPALRQKLAERLSALRPDRGAAPAVSEPVEPLEGFPAFVAVGDERYPVRSPADALVLAERLSRIHGSADALLADGTALARFVRGSRAQPLD